MAISILSALGQLRRGGMEHLPGQQVFEQLCIESGHHWRQRLLDPLVTLKLFMLQIVHGNTAINHLRQLSGLGFVASSYCEARARLPLQVLQALLKKLVESAAHAAEPVVQGVRVLVVDASSFSMADTLELREHFGLPGRQKVGVGYPVCKLLALLDLASGLFVQTLALPLFTHDMRGVVRMHPLLRAGDVLVGDRAFCSVVHLALLARQSIACVFRLHQKRKAPRRGITRWKRPKQSPLWMDRQTLRQLPRWTNVRLIRHVIHQSGYRTQVVWLATTLLDRHRWSDRQIIELYHRRWEIETCFGHLKTSLKMNVLKCRSVSGVMKELTMYLLVYNLVRLLMLKWAQMAGVDVRRVSLIDAARLLATRMLGLSGSPWLIVNPDRSGRTQLRCVRRRPKKYTLLTAPRETYRCGRNTQKTA